jgi:hypothetical protein
MAHWGIAMTLFQPLWPTRPAPAALQRGWDAVQTARRLQPPTARERLFIAATEAFFLEPSGTDYWLRIRRWEQAMDTLYSAFPDDADAAAFYAVAHLATTPANAISRTHADRAAGILLRVYQQNPDHPGAMHYLVHANDVPGRERESLEITRKYDAAAPRNPHALHMPTHIYTRLGEWPEVVRGNLRAAEAALSRPARVGDDEPGIVGEGVAVALPKPPPVGERVIDLVGRGNGRARGGGPNDRLHGSAGNGGKQKRNENRQTPHLDILPCRSLSGGEQHASNSSA